MQFTSRGAGWRAQGHGPSSAGRRRTAQLHPSPLPRQLQFVLTIVQTSCGVVWPCSFPLGWLYFQIGYMISLIVLFTNFYIQVSLVPVAFGPWGLYQQNPSSVCLRGTCRGPAARWALGSNLATATGRPLPLGGKGHC